MSQATVYNPEVAKLFRCTFNSERTIPLPIEIPQQKQEEKEVITYGMQFEKICGAITSVRDKITLTDFRTLDMAKKRIEVEGLYISDLKNPIYLDSVTAKVLIISNCNEVHIGEVNVDQIAVREVETIAMGNIECENMLMFKCTDISVAEFRIQYGVLQGHRIRMGDGSTKKTSVLSDVLFIDGMLDRMSSWDLYSPVVQIGHNVPTMRPTHRMRVYGNKAVPSDWVDTYGKCNLKKVLALAESVVNMDLVAMQEINERNRLLITGMSVFNSIVTLCSKGNTTLVPFNGIVTVAQKALDITDSISKMLDESLTDEEVSVFHMLSPFNDRMIIPMMSPADMQTIGGHVTIAAKATEDETAAQVTPPFADGRIVMLDEEAVRKLLNSQVGTDSTETLMNGGHVTVNNMEPPKLTRAEKKAAQRAAAAAANGQVPPSDDTSDDGDEDNDKIPTAPTNNNA